MWPTAWEKGRKRGLKVQVISFVGVSIGAKHYDASIDEDDNPIWNWKDKIWSNAYVDLDRKGSDLSSPRFYTEKDAMDWVFRMLSVFDPQKYEVHWPVGAPSDFDGETFKWEYLPLRGS